MFIRFLCHACDHAITTPRRNAGLEIACSRCESMTQVPAPRSGTLTPVATGTRCPYCEEVLNPPPKKGQKCRACGQKYRVRQGRVMTREEAARYEEESTVSTAVADLPASHAGKSDAVDARTEQVVRVRKGDAAAKLKQLQAQAVAFPWIQIVSKCDTLSCPHCIARHGTLLPTREITVADLPPYVECICKEAGCRCTYVPLTQADAREQGLE